jgi:hypothetical protein
MELARESKKIVWGVEPPIITNRKCRGEAEVLELE